MNPKLQQIARQAIQQARQDGLDDDDAKWLAIGAVVREARKEGLLSEELSPEMIAAATVLVAQELKKG